MGYMRHHTIVVTGFADNIRTAHRKARALFEVPGEHLGPVIASVSEITPESVNGYRSFFIAPDGSKDGWGASDQGDAARATFVEWARNERFVQFVEVQFGDEEHDTHVVSCDDERPEPSAEEINEAKAHVQRRVNIEQRIRITINEGVLLD